MWLHVLATLILFISAVALPFWVFVILGICATIYFRNYIELVVVALFIDALYGASLNFFWNIPIVVTIVSAIFVGIVSFTRKALFTRAYSRL